MKINSMQLLKELEAAGIETNGCNSNGKVWDKNNKEIQDLPIVMAVIEKHKPKDDIQTTQEDRLLAIEKKLAELIEALNGK